MGGAAVVALVALAGITIKWTTFHSDLYPYTISQPSSYQHIKQQDTSGHWADYFYPSLGSTVTNLNISCDHTSRNTIDYLSSLGGKKVHRSGWLTIMGNRYALIRADFSSYRVNWTIEQMTVPLQGRVWHLTASYEHRFRNQRPIMMRMLRSFRTTASVHGRKLTH